MCEFAVMGSMSMDVAEKETLRLSGPHMGESDFTNYRLRGIKISKRNVAPLTIYMIGRPGGFLSMYFAATRPGAHLKERRRGAVVRFVNLREDNAAAIS